MSAAAACEMTTKRILRTAGVTVFTLVAVAALGTLLVRDQISRHRHDLFSPQPLERLAALSYLAAEPASVDRVLLLRDFIAREPRPLLRRRATALLQRMQAALVEAPGPAGRA